MSIVDLLILSLIVNCRTSMHHAWVLLSIVLINCRHLSIPFSFHANCSQLPHQNSVFAQPQHRHSVFNCAMLEPYLDVEAGLADVGVCHVHGNPASGGRTPYFNRVPLEWIDSVAFHFRATEYRHVIEAEVSLVHPGDDMSIIGSQSITNEHLYINWHRKGKGKGINLFGPPRPDAPDAPDAPPGGLGKGDDGKGKGKDGKGKAGGKRDSRAGLHLVGPPPPKAASSALGSDHHDGSAFESDALGIDDHHDSTIEGPHVSSVDDHHDSTIEDHHDLSIDHHPGLTIEDHHDSSIDHHHETIEDTFINDRGIGADEARASTAFRGRSHSRSRSR